MAKDLQPSSSSGSSSLRPWGEARGNLIQPEIPDLRGGPLRLLCRLWCVVVRFEGWGVGGIAAPLPLFLLLLLLLLLFFGFGALFGPRAGLGLSAGFLGGAKNTVKKKNRYRARARKKHTSRAATVLPLVASGAQSCCCGACEVAGRGEGCFRSNCRWVWGEGGGGKMRGAMGVNFTKMKILKGP